MNVALTTNRTGCVGGGVGLLYSTRLFHEKFVNARDTPTNQSKHPSGQPFGFTAVRHVDCRATTDPAGPRRLTNTATRRSLVC